MRRLAHTRILRGFTLVELVVVIAIVGVMAAIAIPRVASSLNRRRLDAAATRIASDIQLAQRHARQSSASQDVTFDVAGNSYQLTGLRDADRVTERYTVELSQAPYEVTISAADFDGSNVLTFDGYGVPSSGGHVTLLLGADFRNVMIAADTGEVSVTELQLAEAEAL